MNNNDILNVLHHSGESCQPSDRLDPAFVEDSLSGIKRKSNKGVVTTCVTLGVACLTASTVFITQSFRTSKPSDSYDKIYKTIEAVKKESEPSLFEKIFDDGYIYEFAEDTLNSTDEFGFSGSSSSSGADYSDTNVQVDGVDEADVVKTDGKYIYSLNDEEIIISNPNNGKPEFVTSIDTGYKISDMYIHENKLVAIADNQRIIDTVATEDTAVDSDYSENLDTAVIIYDISDINSPEEISTLAQSGDCISTRKIGNVVYLTTDYRIYDFSKIKKAKPETYCPYYITEDEISCVNADDITICDTVDSVDYVTASSIDLDNPEKFADMCSVLGGGDEIYASTNNIYISSYQYIDNSYKTQILRFLVDGTEITPNSSLTVDGDILDQFSMDEYNGYFRVVTQNNNEKFYDGYVAMNTADTTTSLYVFNNDLKQVGKTENVAQGENVKSVRFYGNIAYFVTFRQTDPLFTVDLSNPESPEILSELKIPGFSEYLHVLSDDMLLGFGRDADSYTGISEEFKLTIFDTSDKTDVTEKATEIFGSEYEYSEAEYNHKAVYVDEKDCIIGIPYWSYDDTNSIYYAVYKYDINKNEFVLLKTIEKESSDNPDYFYYNDYIRGLRIDKNFYVVTSDAIYSYDYSTFEETGSIIF